MNPESKISSGPTYKAIRLSLVGATLVTVLSWLLVKSDTLNGLGLFIATVISFPWVFLIFVAVAVFGENQLYALNWYLGADNGWGTVAIAYAIGVWGGAAINLFWFFRRVVKSEPLTSSSVDGGKHD